MAKNKQIKDDALQQKQELQESAQRIFLAGLGALSKAEEEGSKLFKRLVKKGEEYDGPGVEQAVAVRSQLETGMTQLRRRTTEVQEEADKQARKAKEAVDGQVNRARQGLDGLLEGLEGRIERAVTTALHGLGVPTRDEFDALQKSLRQLSKNIDAAKRERQIEHASVPDVEARSVGGGWYEVRVHGLAVDKVQGEEAAAERVQALRAQDFTTGDTEATSITAEATGGGWYEVRVDGVVVDKVQGRKAADAAIKRLETQG